jgi:hypothetical protein
MKRQREKKEDKDASSSFFGVTLAVPQQWHLSDDACPHSVLALSLFILSIISFLFLSFPFLLQAAGFYHEKNRTFSKNKKQKSFSANSNNCSVCFYLQLQAGHTGIHEASIYSTLVGLGAAATIHSIHFQNPEASYSISLLLPDLVLLLCLFSDGN